MASVPTTSIDIIPTRRPERGLWASNSHRDERGAVIVTLPTPLTEDGAKSDRAPGKASPTLECARAVEAAPDVRSLIERMRNTASVIDLDF
ncbi:hypothetical protein O1L60_45390 [Streptomyces diastatochromogenes]|nr:hypothetical protein [Streptomyces diastatochromogenes]